MESWALAHPSIVTSVSEKCTVGAVLWFENVVTPLPVVWICTIRQSLARRRPIALSGFVTLAGPDGGAVAFPELLQDTSALRTIQAPANAPNIRGGERFDSANEAAESRLRVPSRA